MMAYRENLKNNIKALRQSHGLSQKDFAQKIGVTQGFISQVEKGLSSIDADTMFVICKEFDVSADQLSGNPPIGVKPKLPLTPKNEENTAFATQLLFDKPLQEALKIYFTLSPEEKQHIISTIHLIGKRKREE